MRVLTLLVPITALLMIACANPAANKPKASVGNAAPESSPQVGPGEKLPISPANSRIDFVAAKITRSHNGSFKRFNGTVNLVNSTAEQSQVTIDIETNSVMTDEPDLTKHLQTPDFFDVAKFPKASFASTRIEPGSNDLGTQSYTITGNFDLHGVKKSITFPATIQVSADSVSVNAEFAINRKDWGLLYPGKADDLIRDGVVIKLNVNAPRKK